MKKKKAKILKTVDGHIMFKETPEMRYERLKRDQSSGVTYSRVIGNKAKHSEKFACRCKGRRNGHE